MRNRLTKHDILNIIALIIVLVIMLSGFYGCAPAPTNAVGGTNDFQSSTVRFDKLVENSYPFMVVFYVEDIVRGKGCYVYDGSESGSIFCFDLEK